MSLPFALRDRLSLGSPSPFSTQKRSWATITPESPHQKRQRLVRVVLLSCYERLSRSIETVGLQRSDATERSHNLAKFGPAFQLWAGCNVSPLNIILGILCVLKFRIDAVEGFAITVVASIVGSSATGAIARYGPLSGLRTMMISRFTHGLHASRVISALNALMLIAFLIVDTIACRDILQTLAPGRPHIFTLAVVLLGILATTMASFGGPLIEFIGRWGWRPQIMILPMLLGGCLLAINAPGRDPLANTADVIETTIHTRMSFGVLVCNAALVFSMAGTDFSHAYAEQSTQWLVALGPMAGLSTSHIALVTTGIVIGEASRGNVILSQAFTDSPATLIGSSMQQLGPVGIVCIIFFVIGGFGAIAAGTYIAAVSMGPACDRYDRPTRVVCTMAVGVIVVICANLGRRHLEIIAQSIVSIIGSLVIVWWIPTVVDLEIARRKGPLWADWDVPSRLPCRLASLLASIVGAALTVLSIDQPWYVGPLAKVAGPAGPYANTFAILGSTVVVMVPLGLIERRYASSV